MSKYADNLRRKLRSPFAKDKAIVAAANEEFITQKAVAGQVHQNTTLTNMSVQYTNGDFIGLNLMPVVEVAHKSDQYFIYNKRSRLSGPDDRLSGRSSPNEVTDNRSTANYSTKDYGLKNFVDNETLRNQDAPLDEMVDLTEAINDIIALKREQRIAALLTNGSNYGGNTAALVGVDQFDNASNVTIIQKLQFMGESLWTGSNNTKKVAFCSLEVWNAIARNTQIRGLFNYVKDGLASTEQVAKYFGFDQILVSDARQDTANEGQTAAYSRIWGKVFGVLRVAARPTIRSAQFASTFRLKGDPVTDTWYDPSVGKSGGYWARVGLSEDYKIVAPETGYLYTAAIA